MHRELNCFAVIRAAVVVCVMSCMCVPAYAWAGPELAEARNALRANEELFASGLQCSGTVKVVGIGKHAGREIFSVFDSVISGADFLQDSTIVKEKTNERRIDDRVISMYLDGSLHVTQFSPRFKPTGCQTRVSQHEAHRPLGAYTGGTCPWHPMKLFELVFDPGRVEASDMAMEPLSESLSKGTLVTSDGVEITVVLDRQAGFRPVSSKWVKDGVTLRRFSLSWTERAGAWYINAFSVEDHIGNQDVRITFDSFQPLARDPSEVFRLQSLSPCSGSRIIDERDPENVVMRFVPKTPIPDGVRSIEDLPSRIEARQVDEEAPWAPRWVLWANGIGIAVILLIVALRRYFHNRN